MASAPTNTIRMKLDAAMLHPRGQEGYACESTSPEMLLPPMVLDTLLANYAFFSSTTHIGDPEGPKPDPYALVIKFARACPAKVVTETPQEALRPAREA